MKNLNIRHDKQSKNLVITIISGYGDSWDA